MTASTTMTALSSSRKRIEWLDLAKGIGAFLVILGHVSTLKHSLILMIFSFHMPLFFILSGFIFKNKSNFKAHLKAKASTLLVPYFIASGIDIVRVIIRDYANFSTANWVDVIKKFFFIESRPIINNPIWFLFVLFWVEIVYYFVSNFKITTKLPLLIMLISVSYFLDTPFYFGLGIALRALIFFIIGDLLKNAKLTDITKKQAALFVFGFVCFLPIWFTFVQENKFANMLRVGYGESYITYLVFSLVGSFAIIFISILFEKLPFVNFWGKNSLILLICQNYFWSLYRNAILPAIKHKGLLYFLNSKIKGAFFIAICITALCALTAFIINKIKAHNKKAKVSA